MTQTVVQNIDISPGILDINLFGDGYAWAVELRLAALEDLTDATIVARFKPISGATTTLTVVRTDDEDCRFSIGYSSTVEGYYTVAITKPASLPRSYIRGEIRVFKDPSL